MQEEKVVLVHGAKLSFPTLNREGVNTQLEAYRAVIDLQGQNKKFLDESVQMIADMVPCSFAYVRSQINALEAEVEVNEFIARLKSEKLPNGLPTRLSSDNDHPWYDADVIKRVGVKFNGIERKNDVAMYDVNDGFIRVHIRDNKGNWKRSRGRFITVKLNGKVEPFWRS